MATQPVSSLEAAEEGVPSWELRRRAREASSVSQPIFCAAKIRSEENTYIASSTAHSRLAREAEESGERGKSNFAIWSSFSDVRKQSSGGGKGKSFPWPKSVYGSSVMKKKRGARPSVISSCLAQLASVI